MRVIADFHIHSHYSRATSKQMNLEGISSGAKTKGLNLVGTGDFTFPFWLNELKKKLEPIEGAGLFKYSDILFMLTTEVATYFTFKDEMKRVHHVIHAPSFEVVDQINEALSKYGNLASDGRPILNISAPRLVEILMEIDRDILIYPAHCLLPTTRILTNPQSKFINEIKNGDGVYTHLGRIRKITRILKREYSGMIYHIIPWYFSVGTKMTPEHPILIVKTFKKCRWTNGICKKTCSQLDSCKRKYFQYYKPCWIQAKNIEKGDALLYPRFKEVRDVKKLELSKYLKKIPVNFPKQVNINKDFCRLIGYFVSEGYTFRDGIGFTFNEKEKKYVKDVKKLIFNILCIKAKKGKTKGDLIFYSRTLAQLLKKLCYFNKPFNAHHKCLPNWMLKLPLKKQVEVLRGWWRGDKGSTSSPVLMNQMKIICLRLGIVPSIRIDSAELHKKRGRHLIKKREIKAKFDNFIFDRLSFFEDKFNLLEERCFKKFKRKTKRQYGWVDENYVYLPIRIIKREYYNGPVFNLEVKEDNSYLTEFATVHNCWTPWMSCFGSKSGFDSIEECYQDQAKHIYALETGMSSDPAMNWRLSALDKLTLVSNSDSHSPWSWRLGREANVFELKDINYWEIFNTIKNKNKEKFLFTIETSPFYGKYHYTGHRTCNINLHPKDAIKLNNICPKCGRKLTIGVLQRVEELADRPEGFVPKNAIPFKTLLPLYEIISFAWGAGELYSKKVLQEHNKLIENFGNELNVLLNVPREELIKITNERIVEAIIKAREGKVKYIAGYDGMYGVPLFNERAAERKVSFQAQKSLKDF